MQVRIVNAFRSQSLIERWDEIDPFQHATPCWMVNVYSMLPPETITTIDKEELNRMAIKIVQETQAPDRMYKKGVVSTKKDYAEVLSALREMKTGQALVVTMDAKEWEGVKKPETTFAANLRRYFENKGLQITAYQSNALEITIRKATALDKHQGGKKKKSA
jgi:hypothetical protein